MLRLMPLLLIAVIAVIAVLATHHSHRPAPFAFTRSGNAEGSAPLDAPATALPPPVTIDQVPATSPPNTALEAALGRWRDAGLVTPQQARAIEEYEQSLMAQVRAEPLERQRRVPLVAEALGYLGGTLGLVGLTLLVARYWQHMPTLGRLGLTGGAAVLLALGGYLVHEATDAAFMRLRWFLWVISAAAAGMFAGVLAHSGMGADAPTTIALTVAAIVAVQNGIFWGGNVRPIQQALALSAGVVVVGTLVAQWAGDTPSGLAVWTAGAILLLAGARGMLSLPPLTAGIGAVATLVGASMITDSSQGPGLVFLLLTSAALLTIVAVPDGGPSDATRVVLTVVGALGMLQGTPMTVAYFAEQAGIVTGLVVSCVGGCLLLLAARQVVRAPIVVELAGGFALVLGAAVTGAQSVAFATILGVLTAVALIGLGTLPGRVLSSLFGSLGLLINVPWAISHFFPGEGRVPLLIFASGAVIIAVAVWLARMGGRFRRELRR